MHHLREKEDLFFSYLSAEVTLTQKHGAVREGEPHHT